jgi:hypothetical protein
MNILFGIVFGISACLLLFVVSLSLLYWKDEKSMGIFTFDNIMCTTKQREYIEILTNDIGYSRHQRNAHINDLIFRKITHLDEMTKSEASIVISDFKRIKESKNDKA